MDLNYIIIIAVCFISVIIAIIKAKETVIYFDKIDGFLIGFVALIISFAVSIAILWILPAQTETIKSTNQLVCLQDNTQTNGSFFLGSGTIKDEQVFAYYEKQKYGYKLKYVNAKNAIIIYSNKVPKIVKCLKQTKKMSIGYDFPDSLVKIYIPYNSIQNNFLLDAK